MKEYKIFKHPQNQIEAVKQGWSWPAFFFASYWALSKKMWGLGIGSLVAYLVVGFIVDAIAGKFVASFPIVVAYWFASSGNKWREKNLSSRGYDEVATVQASTPEGAIAKYLPARPGTREPEIEILEEESQPKVRIECRCCGLAKDVPRSKFGDRTGTVKVKCPNCKEVLPVFLGN